MMLREKVLTIRSNQGVRCGQVITLIEWITPLPLFINLDTVVSGLGVEERSVMSRSQGLEVVAE